MKKGSINNSETKSYTKIFTTIKHTNRRDINTLINLYKPNDNRLYNTTNKNPNVNNVLSKEANSSLLNERQDKNLRLNVSSEPSQPMEAETENRILSL